MKLREVVWKILKTGLLLSTLILILFFVGGSLYPGVVPPGNWPLEVTWTFLVVTLVVFIRAIWPPGKLERLIKVTKLFIVLLGGLIFLLVGFVMWVVIPPMVSGLSAWFYVFPAWILLQGSGMVVWAFIKSRELLIHPSDS